jgi:PIN domain nuclease of toxin-antitoxin system
VLPPVHRDPFDRMIVAQGIADQMTVMTSNPVFKRYKSVRVIDA